MKIEFRPLHVNEVETRVLSTYTKQDKEGKTVPHGLTLLIHKNARVDMQLLDEVVGAENWQRDHFQAKNTLFCRIGIWDEDKKQWIWKADCGEEGNASEKKSESSDSFKRAATNWGIGRELYSAPFIWVKAEKVSWREKKDKKTGEISFTTKDEFEVRTYNVEEKKIVGLEIWNKTAKIPAFVWGKVIDFTPMEPRQ